MTDENAKIEALVRRIADLENERDAAVARNIELVQQVADVLEERIPVADWCHNTTALVREWAEAIRSRNPRMVNLSLPEVIIAHEDACAAVADVLEQLEGAILDQPGWCGTEGMPPSHYASLDWMERVLAAVDTHADAIGREIDFDARDNVNNGRLMRADAHADRIRDLCKLKPSALVPDVPGAGAKLGRLP